MDLVLTPPKKLAYMMRAASKIGRYMGRGMDTFRVRMVSQISSKVINDLFKNCWPEHIKDYVLSDEFWYYRVPFKKFSLQAYLVLPRVTISIKFDALLITARELEQIFYYSWNCKFIVSELITNLTFLKPSIFTFPI